MDKEHSFKSVMASIATMYDKQITRELVIMYWDTLSFAKPEHLQRALSDHIADKEQGRFMPKPAHLIAWIESYQAHDKRQTEMRQQLEQSRIEKKPQNKTEGLEILKKLKAEL